jgi:hypothetical protein
MSMTKASRSGVALAVVVCVLGLPSPALALTDFTWSGAAPVGTSGWSNSSNWAGGTAPSGAVGTLTFPALTNPACTSSPPTATCFTSSNDITGLNVNLLSIDDGGPFSSNYQISGNAITLGAGGLTAGTTSSTFGNPSVRLPITLGASQTWSIDGNNNNSQIGLYASVTGPSTDTLGIALSHRTFLGLNGNDVEVGPVTITGPNGAGSGNSAFLNGAVAIGNPSGGAQLNATDGNPVSVTHAGITSSNGTVGPLTMTGGNLQVGQGGGPSAGTLNVNGALTLDGASAVTVFINQSGTTAGTDYSQLGATGTVDLGNARLTVGGGGGSCPTLTEGDVDTLVTSATGLRGTFAGIPDGTTVPLGCSPTPQPQLRINYTSHTVTATVVASSSPPPPVIGQTATVAPEKGKVLIKLPPGSSPKAFGLSAAAAAGFVPLTAGATVPVGATLDTTHGQVRLNTATNRSGGTQTGHFSKGVFTVLQGRKNPLTTISMAGGGLNSCNTKVPQGGAAKQATAARTARRSLFSNVHGHFRSRGRNSAATVRGTKWTMTDTCAGTLTTVARGSVVVRDFRLRKNVVVKAGHKYLARAVKLGKH